MPTAQNPKPDAAQIASKNRPVAEFRDRELRVTIWQSSGSDGVTRYNFTQSRSYKVGEQWFETAFMGQPHVQRLRKLLDRADDWITDATTSARYSKAKAA